MTENDYRPRPRTLWLDTKGEPVVTSSINGERNARRWGWTPAVARPLDPLVSPHPTPADETARLPVPGGPKMLRETLCVAQVAIGNRPTDLGRRDKHIDRLGVLIDALDVMRPLGTDGKHGDRHTPVCGCDDNPLAASPADTDTAEQERLAQAWDEGFEARGLEERGYNGGENPYRATPSPVAATSEEETRG